MDGKTPSTSVSNLSSTVQCLDEFSGILESCSARQSCIFMRVALMLVTLAFPRTSKLLTCHNLMLNNNAFFLV